MNLTDSDWAMIANALRACAALNEREAAGTEQPDNWRQQAARERLLATRIEHLMGV